MSPRTREQTARDAEASTANEPGMCLQWSRERAAIGPLYPDASTAWKRATSRHTGDRFPPPRGVFVFWTGGARGFGHIAVSLGNGLVRSTDAGGRGRVATVRVGWVASTWGHRYAGWADNVNGVKLATPKPPTLKERVSDLEETVKRLRDRIRALEK